MKTLRKDKDSKVSRSFLGMVLKEMGKPVPVELQLNSWELFDLIAKNIHIIRDKLSRQEKVIHDMAKMADENKQSWAFAPEHKKFERNKAILEAVEEYYEKKK